MFCLFKDVLFVGLGDCGDGPPLVALGTEVARGEPEVPRTQMVALGLASAVQSTPEFGLLAEPVSTAHARSELADRGTFVQLEQDTMLPPPCGLRWPQGRMAYCTVVASHVRLKTISYTQAFPNLGQDSEKLGDRTNTSRHFAPRLTGLFFGT